MALTAMAYAVILFRTARAAGALAVSTEGVALGAVTNFFDTLGIGSFAPSTAWIKLRKLIPDSHIPAVLIAGHALPTIAQGLIFVTLVEVDPVLLIACIAAAVTGALVGAPIAIKLPVKVIQMTVGIALLLAAAAFSLSNLGLMPGGGTALSLAPLPFGIALVGSFLSGAMMTVGIGFYAPLLAMFGLLGLEPRCGFPDHGRGRRADDAGQLDQVPEVRPHRSEAGAVAGARRHPGGAARCLCGEVAAARDAALGGDGGGALHRNRHAAFGHQARLRQKRAGID